ncbi:squalene-hopene-cyclase [Kalymmatonema gypsitolerans NIES-4073]|nr:squalene-hopene-cyclase [Scytonema sp. NIES-4073]
MVTSLTKQSQPTLGLKLRDMVLALLQEMVADYDEKWGGGKMSAAAYDVAWVAMVRERHNPEQLAFPDSFNWLLRHQSRDGSWGYPPQTIVPTLAGLLALLKAPQQTESTRNAAKRAEAHLRTALRQWSIANHESIAFEILVPTLLHELEKLGVVFEFPGKAELLKIYHHKLSIASPELIYTGKSGLIFSVEAFAPSIEFQRLKPLQITNGSYGNSPAATAAVLIHSPEWDTAAADWLTHLSNQARRNGDPGAMPNAYPIDVFEGSWVLYNLIQGGFDFKDEAFRSVGKKLLIWLEKSLTQKGASFSRLTGVVTDSDDTGMLLAAHNLLAEKTGMKTVSVDCLQNFERDTYFACFELERGISLSANAHVLAALLSVPTLPDWVVKNNSINKVIDYLYSTKNSAGYWEDKWHESPFYVTAIATMALTQHPSPSVRNQLQPTVEWVLATQSAKDGGWGMNGSGSSTLEETAYALQILNAVRQKPLEKTLRTTQPSLSQAIRRGVDYLWQHLDELSSTTEIAANSRLPRLWRGKQLYLPSRVVFSAVLAVLYQAFASEQAVAG